MQQAIGCLSRFVSRSILNGVVNVNSRSLTDDHGRGCATYAECAEDTKGKSTGGTKLLTAVSGFPKQTNGGYNIDNIIKGQIGDDAYFIARHVDEWDNDEELAAVSPRSPEIHKLSDGACRADMGRPLKSADVIGVADGVGGWRLHGIDPGLFSKYLMKSCEKLVNSGLFMTNEPSKLIEDGFREMKDYKRQINGSSTACVMVLSHADLMLYTANIGDSGFLVVREGRLVHRSTEQVHYFNTPFQLSLPPTGMGREVLGDSPDSADSYAFNVRNGDVILLATDGIFDNVPDSLLIDEMSRIKGCVDGAILQRCANSIALIARKLSQDQHYVSPFTLRARQNGIEFSGGKIDDITVLLATVVIS